ncbi:MAG: Fic family protein [Geminicoccaceae bacterium]|nr:Fic family protein [Geminicoccaceae bacterium]
MKEASNYVAAIGRGLEFMRDGLPISSRLIRETQAVLLHSGRGTGKQPGAFRTQQVWIGGTRLGNATFVPPPHDLVPDLVADFERFIHREDDLPPLVRADIAHVHFETIHPFLDGNGRVGRLLITLMLREAGRLAQPLLYLSLYFKQNQEDDYRLLNGVRFEGGWEAWLGFFLPGVRDTAGQAADSTKRLLARIAADREVIDRAELRAHALTVRRVFTFIQERPVFTVRTATENTSLSQPAVDRAVRTLEGLGIVREVTGRKSRRVYVHERYLAILNEGI